MNLLDIKDPTFLKELNFKELNELSEEIRSFLVEKISKTGGHLSSNLGIVELTIAMHYVFNSPNDKFIFDVGHQSYVHKILTGRANQFDTLRQYKGMSGYQKRKESPHDPWEAGHSSTAIAALAGFCLASKINQSQHKCIAVVGDGSLNSGLSFEALNYLGHDSGTAPIIILNDNEMSISKNVGTLSKMLMSLRASNMYVKTAASKRRFPKWIYSLKVRTGKFLKGLAGANSLFDDLGFSYYGPIDGHDIKTLVKFLILARRRNKPIVLHVVTKKGKGYLPAETDTIGKWHGVPKFDIEKGEFLKKNKESHQSWSSIFSEIIEGYAKDDDAFRVVMPAMTYGSSFVDFEKKYPDKYIDVGICESFALVYSTALALNDVHVYIPIYSSFLQRAYDQVLHDLARQHAKVVIGIDHAGIVGADGETHQGIYDLAYLGHIPNIEIVQPSTVIEAKRLLDYAFNGSKNSVGVRYSKGSIDKTTGQNLSKITRPIWLEYSNQANKNIIAYGDTFTKLKSYIDDHHLNINIYNALFIKPMDLTMLDKILESHHLTYVVEDVIKTGGLGSRILEYASEHNKDANTIKIIGYPNEFIEHGDVLSIEKQYELDTESIIKKVLK